MADGLGARLQHAWNAFTNRVDRAEVYSTEMGVSYGSRPDRVRTFVANERSIISSIYTRLSVDCASVDFRHVRLDEQNRYLEDMDSTLNECLSLEANIDQTGRELLQDAVFTMCDHGTAAIVAVETTLNPNTTGGYDILKLRVGEVVQWFPRHVKVNLYNEDTGRREEITLPKHLVAVVPNPFYAVMNAPNSTLQRIIRKLNQLDAVDEQAASGKLDIIIQLPYTVKSPLRKQQANERRKDMELQLKGSQYGIAWADSTEKITQLNRPAENNLLKSIEYLMALLYSQLGITAGILDGTADEKVMLNYVNRTMEPFLTALQENIKRKFLTKTARTQKQSIEYFRDPFRLVPISEIAEIADKFTRNEIATSNEIRQVVGWKPSTDPKADQLVNSNMPQSDTGVPEASTEGDGIDEIGKAIDEVFKDLGVDENAVG